MKYSINGSTVTLNKDILSEESLNTMCKEIDSSYESCSKAIEAYNLVSNIKAMESFGYKATEGLGESIKNGAKAVWEKIKEFFKKIVEFFKRLFQSKKIENTGKKAKEVKTKASQLETSSNIKSNDTVIISGLLYNLLKDPNNYIKLKTFDQESDIAYDEFNKFVRMSEGKFTNLLNLIKSGQYINEDKDIEADLFTRDQIQKLRSGFDSLIDKSNQVLSSFDQSFDNTPVNLSVSDFLSLIKSQYNFFSTVTLICIKLTDKFDKYNKLANRLMWTTDIVLSKDDTVHRFVEKKKLNTYYTEIGRCLSINLSTTMGLTKKLNSIFDTLLTELTEINSNFNNDVWG